LALSDSPIPLFAPGLEEQLEEVIERQAAVMRSGRYVLGPELEAFEAEFAAHLGVRHCIGVGNGTDALTLALRGLGIGRGDEVVVPALTFVATAEAVINAGATPVFCDVDRETLTITAATAEPAIGERTRALLPVHLFGNPAPIGELRELADAAGLALLEDAAQAAGAELDGARAGALGDAATFSFYPSKNLGGFGDGGAVTTDDEELAGRLRRLRNHGSEDKRVNLEPGFNSRLDELQAAALRVLLPHLEAASGARRELAARYAAGPLAGQVEPQAETPGGRHCYHLYAVRSERRGALAARLAEAEIGARPYYTTPLHLQPSMADFRPSRPLPVSEDFAARSLALPIGPGLSREQVDRVAAVAAEALGNLG
jgi:dTDP-3-amino-3,4,6-trideoxy-alpha-D-glucose transaminase